MSFLKDQVWSRLRNTFSLLTTAINVIVFNGTHIEPLSSRCYREASNSKFWFGLMVCVNYLFSVFGQKHHCRGSYRYSQRIAADYATKPWDYPKADNWK